MIWKSLFIALIFCPILLAQESSTDRGDLRWSLGVGVISSPRPYVDAENETRVIPLLELSYKRFFVRGVMAGFHLVDHRPWSVDLEARVQFAGLDAEDSPFLEGMEKRRETVEAGLVIGQKLGPLECEGSLHVDALGRSHGVTAQIDLAWSRVFDRGRAGVFPQIGIVWHNDKMVDYLAGVRPEEARPWRPEYEGEAVVNFEAGIRGFFRFSKRISGIAFVQTERLGSQLDDSPIIDDTWGAFGLMGLTYSF